MGFPSPAQDYIENRLDLNRVFIMHPSATSLFESSGLQYLVDSALKPSQGHLICFELFGNQSIGRMAGRAIITEDGEAYEGDTLEEVTVLGVVVLTITPLYFDRRPSI